MSAGCAHCYADAMSKRNPATLGVWGSHGARVVAAESYWRQPLKWDKDAAAAGEQRRVFVASMADVFEGPETMPAEAWPAVQEARARLFELIGSTIHLDWLLLTKRPQNVMRFLPPMWGNNLLLNMWIGTSVEDQAAADERIPHLIRVPARVRFLSLEPLLGPVDLGHVLIDDWTRVGNDVHYHEHPALSWLIVGGESGPRARPMHPDWARALRDQAQAAGVAFFMKQLGGARDARHDLADLPEDLRIREVPYV